MRSLHPCFGRGGGTTKRSGTLGSRRRIGHETIKVGVDVELLEMGGHGWIPELEATSVVVVVGEVVHHALHVLLAERATGSVVGLVWERGGDGGRFAAGRGLCAAASGPKGGDDGSGEQRHVGDLSRGAEAHSGRGGQSIVVVCGSVGREGVGCHLAWFSGGDPGRGERGLGAALGPGVVLECAAASEGSELVDGPGDRMGLGVVAGVEACVLLLELVRHGCEAGGAFAASEEDEEGQQGESECDDSGGDSRDDGADRRAGALTGRRCVRWASAEGGQMSKPDGRGVGTKDRVDVFLSSKANEMRGSQVGLSTHHERFSHDPTCAADRITQFVKGTQTSTSTKRPQVHVSRIDSPRRSAKRKSSLNPDVTRYGRRTIQMCMGVRWHWYVRNE